MTTYRPAYFGLVRILKRAIDSGFTRLNFGASLGIESLEKFKRIGGN